VAVVVSLTGVLSLSAGSLPWDRTGSPVAADSEPADAASGLSIQASDAGVTISQPQLTGIKKIKHIVMIMQENRSFDHYFGTFPGADGIPMRDGVPIACVPTGMAPPGTRVHPALPRQGPARRGWGASRSGRGRRHQRRQDGRLLRLRRRHQQGLCADGP